MRCHLSRIGLVVVLLLPPTGCKKPPFEGEVDLGVGDGRLTVTVKLKGDLTRLEIDARGRPHPDRFIVNGATKKLIVVAPSRREYTEASLDWLESLEPPSNVVVTRTGRTDTVLGYGCEVISVSDPASPLRREICLSKELPPLRMQVAPTSETGTGFDPRFATGFPLRIALYDASGALIAKMEATRVEKKKELASDFEVPATYKMIPMPNAPSPR